MAQLAERSLAIPEVPGSNPVIGKEKEAGDGPFKKHTDLGILIQHSNAIRLGFEPC